MPQFINFALFAAVQLAATMPSSSPKSAELEKRQGADNNIYGCTESGCTDCPVSFGTGSGFPECIIYDTAQLRDQGYPVEDNGQSTIFFDVPPLDSGCQVIVRTPVVPTENDCGGNVLIAQGATCAPVRVDNTFITLFCCGTDDCAGAGAPPAKRSPNPAANAFGGSGAMYMTMRDRDGNVIPPRNASSTSISERDVVKPLKKRDCESFTVTRQPYTVSGGNNIVSDTVTCSQTESCDATLGSSVTETWGVDVSVSVGDPFGIVSASVGVSWEQSIERSFSGTFTFGPGERGYVVFIPLLTCVEGAFDGDCEGNGQVVTACGPTSAGGEMTGDLRAVTIRG
ncbi:hypothetical protein M409DRAFT_27114 [Zasmidium cellare ATCC 36951]|uniref:Uncharacterized protein n=1 Tax=Zasmidium cellare ATCC 36951 TaxID=1080233 RepID=A0A6A6C617_ZASCE|nr:uncharacterized protein M409DRAFT_27114 [Zasmidium cellare ATCC 36951]KAF2162491.1 hypothetical protein M409DRAFT_27114 [Zasmidium cellare ATCC 36951]